MHTGIGQKVSFFLLFESFFWKESVFAANKNSQFTARARKRLKRGFYSAKKNLFQITMIKLLIKKYSKWNGIYLLPNVDEPCGRVKIAAGKKEDFVPRRSLSLSKCFMSSAACTSQRKQLKCTRRKSGNRDLWEKTTLNQYGCGSWLVMVMMPCRYYSSDATCCFRCVSFLVTLFWARFFLLYTSIYNFILCKPMHFEFAFSANCCMHPSCPKSYAPQAKLNLLLKRLNIPIAIRYGSFTVTKPRYRCNSYAAVTNGGFVAKNQTPTGVALCSPFCCAHCCLAATATNRSAVVCVAFLCK